MCAHHPPKSVQHEPVKVGSVCLSEGLCACVCMCGFVSCGHTGINGRCLFIALLHAVSHAHHPWKRFMKQDVAGKSDNSKNYWNATLFF